MYNVYGFSVLILRNYYIERKPGYNNKNMTIEKSLANFEKVASIQSVVRLRLALLMIQWNRLKTSQTTRSSIQQLNEFIIHRILMWTEHFGFCREISHSNRVFLCSWNSLFTKLSPKFIEKCHNILFHPIYFPSFIHLLLQFSPIPKISEEFSLVSLTCCFTCIESSFIRRTHRPDTEKDTRKKKFPNLLEIFCMLAQCASHG